MTKVDADRADDERDEQEQQREAHHQARERLAAQERAVRPVVDDVERALEHAEERERPPEEERAADHAERGRVVLDLLHRARIESSEVLGNVRWSSRTKNDPLGLVGRPEQREREQEQRHEGEQREVRDHRREVRPRSAKNLRRIAVMGASMLRRMDAATSAGRSDRDLLAGRQVAIVDLDGSLLASTARDPLRAERFVSGIGRLLDEADRLAKARGLVELTQLEVSTLGGSVFVVRRGGRMVAATTRADPTVGLIFYDLKHCLGSIEEAPGGEPPSANGKQSESGERSEARVRCAAQEGRQLCVSRSPS